MLTELAVRDLGVIDELSIVLASGMTVLTGETGAGKTLIVGAIDLLTGGRADAALVRPGAPHAEIEGRFVAGDTEKIVRRVIPAEGRSRAYIDGHLATVGALGELGRGLVDLHGQHAHQSLLRGAVQRAALDRFGDVDTARLESLIDDLRAVDAGLAELGGDARSRFREIDLLRHQLAEIDGAAISDPDEDERLDRDESALADAAAHREAGARAIGLLGADGVVSEGLGQAQAALAGRDPFAGLTGRLADATAEIADVAAEVRSLTEALEDDPAALASLRDRRQLLAELRRKYVRLDPGGGARVPLDGCRSPRRVGGLRGEGHFAGQAQGPRYRSAWRLRGLACGANGPRPRRIWQPRSRGIWRSWPWGAPMLLWASRATRGSRSRSGWRPIPATSRCP